MTPDSKEEIMEAFKTYSVGMYAWVVAAWNTYAPGSLGEWTELFNCAAAFLALILVILRFRHDIFYNFRRRSKK